MLIWMRTQACPGGQLASSLQGPPLHSERLIQTGLGEWCVPHVLLPFHAHRPLPQVPHETQLSPG